MALHATPADHDADPPSSWTVAHHGRRWALKTSRGAVLQTYPTKREAEAATVGGFYVRLYEDEGRWFRGEAVRNWKPFRPESA